MTVKNVFTVAAVLTLVLGVSWLLVPEPQLASLGLATSSSAVYMSRRYAVLFLGNAVILWFARAAPPSPALRAIVAGSFVGTAIMFLVSLHGVAGGATGRFGLLPAGIEAVLTVAFGALLFSKKRPAA